MSIHDVSELPQRMLLYASELMEESRASMVKDQNKSGRYLDFMERTLLSYGRLIVANEEAKAITASVRKDKADES